MGFVDEFARFLEEYRVIGLAIAFVIGAEVNSLVNTIVEEAIMPIVGVFLPSGGWQQATFTIFQIEFGVGQLLSATINFVIIALLVFIFVKYVLGREEINKISKQYKRPYINFLSVYCITKINFVIHILI